MENCHDMDLSIEECTSHIYEEDIDKALFHIFNALKVLEVPSIC